MNLLRIKKYVYVKLFYLFYKDSFGYMGKNVRVYAPLSIEGIGNIKINNNVTIGYKGWLASKGLEKGCMSVLEIGSETYIGNFSHIYSTKKITIGKNVLIADNVYISDNLHSYEDINTPIMYQTIKQCNSVDIGDGSWIGEHVCIIGAKIGKNCVIGANSVVTKDIPDFSIAVGSPAKIIKQYNVDNSAWEKMNHIIDD